MNLSSQNTPPEKEPPPIAGAAADQNPELRSILASLNKFKDLSPVQMMAMVSPEFADALKTDKATEMIEAYAGLFWGAGLDLGVPLPQWAKAASEKAWQALGLNFIHELKDAKPEAIGKFVEVTSMMQTTGGVTIPARQVLDKLIQFIKGDAGNLPAEELKQFAEGRMAVPKMIEKAKNPTERVIALFNIACIWREIEKLGSHAKTHKWLADNKIISPKTDRAETAKWFREIGLPKGKAGRPPKNTDCVEIE